MIRPLADNVILQKEKPINKTASGIILTSSVEDDKSIATVLAVGNGLVVDGKLQPIDIKAGEKVIFKKYSTTEIKLNEEEYLVISSKDILAVVEEK